MSITDLKSAQEKIDIYMDVTGDTVTQENGRWIIRSSNGFEVYSSLSSMMIDIEYELLQIKKRLETET